MFPRGAWEQSASPIRSTDKNLSSERGISLIELIMFIVIVSVALAGVMLVMNTTTRYSADPLIHKQALTVAESLLEEIEQKAFTHDSGQSRQNFNDIFDYNALNPASATYANSSVAVAGLESYSVTVAVVSGVTLPGVQAASAAQITVAVTEPGGQVIEVTGYKVAY
jgi:MSHA pilin protein MshD